MLSEQTITAVKIRKDLHLLKDYLGIGRIFNIVLSDEDVYPQNQTSPGVLKYTYPSVVGTSGATDYVLTRHEEMIGFLNAAPDRLVAVDSRAYSSRAVWSSSSPYVYADPEWPERLCVVVENSTFYSRPGRMQDREYTGMHTVQIVGTDENDAFVHEYLQILDDGVFYTRNIFKTVTEVVSEGFDGDININWFSYQNSFEVDPYRQAVFDDFEGPLRLSLSTKAIDGVTYSYVEYSSPRFKVGSQYRRPEITVLFTAESLAEVALLSSSGSSYIAVDLSINYQTAKMYVLDDQGNIHIYDHELFSFVKNILSETETPRTYMELIPLRSRAKYGDIEFLYTDFKRNRFPINKIEIKRIAPDGTVNYLQIDKSTWGAGQAYIVSKGIDGRLPEQSWQDFRFTTEYDQLGQWEYTLTCITTNDTTKYVTAVLVGYMNAEVSISTSVVSPLALSFSKEDYVAVMTATTVHYFAETADAWIADVRLGQVLMRTEYDSVEVTY